MRIVRIDNGVSGLWSRDLRTLWEGIKRTFAPMKRWNIISSLITVFFMAFLPFLLLPYTFLSAIDVSNAQLSGLSGSSIQKLQLQLASYAFYLNLTSCLIIIISTGIKDIRKYRISPFYSLLSFLGAGFLMISYIASMISIFLKHSISERQDISYCRQQSEKLTAVLSVSAYRKTNVQKIKYAIMAFGLFALFLLFEAIEKFFKPIYTAYTDIFVAPIVLAIVVLFFFAIIRKR
jgi:hypothetical protein